jgi:flagellar hook-length control protein FliK
MTVQVSPHGLGNVTARLDARGSQVTVSMTADNEAGREALRNALPSLTEHLRTGSGQHVDVSLDTSTGDRAGADSGGNAAGRRTETGSSAAGSGATTESQTPLLTTAIVGDSDRLLDLSL